MLSPGHPFLFWFTMKSGMHIESLLTGRLFLLHLKRVGLCPGIFPDTCHLPGYFQAWLPSGNRKPAIRDLPRDMKAGSRRADRGQLVPEVAIDRLEPSWKLYLYLARQIESDYPVVDILHLR